jgi:hypothetical protein
VNFKPLETVLNGVPKSPDKLKFAKIFSRIIHVQTPKLNMKINYENKYPQAEKSPRIFWIPKRKRKKNLQKIIKWNINASFTKKNYFHFMWHDFSY